MLVYRVDDPAISDPETPFAQEFSSKGLSEVRVNFKIINGRIQSAL